MLRFAWRNILGDGFRSLAVFSCAAIVASMALIATFVVRGAEAGLKQNLQRMGADILVLPWGTITEKIGGARLMSAAIEGWMPRAYIEKIDRLEGVARVSPQLYLASVVDSGYSSKPEISIVAFEPLTDFTLLPWADDPDSIQGLQSGQAIVGSSITLHDNSPHLTLLGNDFQVTGRLQSTGTNIDQTVFISFETAEQLSSASQQPSMPLEFSRDKISALMVEVELGYRSQEVAVRILEEIPGVVPLETPDLFQAERGQMIGVLRTLLSIMVGVWGLAVIFIGLVFSIVVNDRKRDIGVLRALGSPGRFIQKTLLMEGVLIATAGGMAGVLLTSLAIYTFGERLASLVSLPLVLPTPLGLASLSIFGQLVTVGSVALAAYLPARLVSKKEPAMVMRA